nr:hypothetical protein BaRGS_006640 [Batillaria attramentaria]
MEDRLQTVLDEPQATQSRPRSCEDKLIATQERLESAERKLALVDDTISDTDVLSITVRNQGSTFVRWGRTQCPNNTQLVYTGVAGGGSHDQKGAPANRLCLTMEPEFDDAAAGPSQNFNYLYGLEYQDILGHLDHDALCSVCRAPQSTTIMVPATLTCPPGWVTQYRGHLVADYHNHPAASEYQCLDGEPEHRLGGQVNRNGALWY